MVNDDVDDVDYIVKKKKRWVIWDISMVDGWICDGIYVNYIAGKICGLGHVQGR